MGRTRTGIYVASPDPVFRWALRQAALDERKPMRGLVLGVLFDWLTDRGYLPPADMGSAAASGAGPRATSS
jgi:hypothetical protein